METLAFKPLFLSWGKGKTKGTRIAEVREWREADLAKKLLRIAGPMQVKPADPVLNINRKESRQCCGNLMCQKES